jgi:mRNA-capping enzyme
METLSRIRRKREKAYICTSTYLFVSILKPAYSERCLTSCDYQMESNDQSNTSEGNKRSCWNYASGQPAKRFREAPQGSSVREFFLPLPEVMPVRHKSLRENIQQKYRQFCRWTRPGFPGSHPVQMHCGNYEVILQSPYMVTWKPSGKRYMMLIKKENEVYMLDLGNSLFSVDHIQFPCDAEYTRHLTDTLVDGELVKDKVNGSNKARFFINDIITYKGTDVSSKPFPDRLELISQSIVNMHNNAISNGYIKKRTQPFSIGTKDFFGLSEMNKLRSPKYLASIPHEVEGFFFLPEKDPYTPGECPYVFKWEENATIKFRLEIFDKFSMTAAHPEKEAQLFLNRMPIPFATMRYLPNLEKYDKKIISCYYRNSQWHVYRLRHDRWCPNSEKTANSVMEAVQRPVTRENLRDLIKNQSKNNVHGDDSSCTT